MGGMRHHKPVLPVAFDGPELPAGLEVERPRLLEQPAPGPQLAGLEAPAVDPGPPAPPGCPLPVQAPPAAADAPAPLEQPAGGLSAAELATMGFWPAWRCEHFMQRAAALAGVVSPEEADRAAYLEAAALAQPSGAEPPAASPARRQRPAVDLADTPEAWAAFLRGAPWIGPAERRRILADAFGSSPTPRPRSHP